MFPRIPMDDSVNGGRGDSVLPGEPLHAIRVVPSGVTADCRHLSTSVATTDLSDLICGQACQVVRLAVLEQKPLNSIGHVLVMRSAQQMGGVAARLLVAGVAYQLANTKRGIQEGEQQRMGVVTAPLVSDPAVPILTTTAPSPRPATVWASRTVNLRPEVLDHRGAAMRSCVAADKVCRLPLDIALTGAVLRLHGRDGFTAATAADANGRIEGTLSSHPEPPTRGVTPRAVASSAEALALNYTPSFEWAA